MIEWPHSGFHVHDGVLVPEDDTKFAMRLALLCEEPGCARAHGVLGEAEESAVLWTITATRRMVPKGWIQIPIPDGRVVVDERRSKCVPPELPSCGGRLGVAGRAAESRRQSAEEIVGGRARCNEQPCRKSVPAPAMERSGQRCVNFGELRKSIYAADTRN